MRRFGFYLLVLLFAEVFSIVLAADLLGGVPTLVLMALSFAAGLFMLRRVGFSSVLLAGALFDNPQGVSLYQLLWPLRYVVAALLLMSPGMVSTLLAVGLLLPLKGGEPLSSARPHRGGGRGDVIDGEYSTVRPEAAAEPMPRLEERGGRD